MTDVSNFKIRGRNITRDADGRLRLNDIHSAAGFSKNQGPADWMRLSTTHKRIERLLELNTGKSRNWAKNDFRAVCYTKRGAGGGTYADPRLALDYAEYLSPKLAIEVKEVFLRYKAGDPALADDVLERATPEENEWAARRAMSRVVRSSYVGELQVRGVDKPFQFGVCTNETYQGLFDLTAKEMRAQRSLKKATNLRDSMSMSELAYIAASEALAVERMGYEESEGFKECKDATSKAAGAIRSAIDSDRANRQKRLAG